jgi:hypothetical protein
MGFVSVRDLGYFIRYRMVWKKQRTTTRGQPFVSLGGYTDHGALWLKQTTLGVNEWKTTALKQIKLESVQGQLTRIAGEGLGNANALKEAAKTRLTCYTISCCGQGQNRE